MGKPLIGTNAELSDALHALAYSLGRADARRRDKAPYGDPTQRAFSRNALKEYLVNAILPYKDIDQLAVSYGQGYRDQYEEVKPQG